MKKQNKSKGKFKWNSTRNKLIANMTAMALIPLLVLTIVSNVITKTNFTDELEHTTEETTEQASKSLDYKLQGVANQLHLLSHNINFTEFYENPMNATYGFYLLEGTLNTSDEYANVYFASTKKDMVMAPKDELPENYDPTQRDWYKGAVKKDGQVFYSEPYQDAVTNQTIITIAQAVKDKQENIVGVAAVDLDISNFSKAVSDIQIGEKGYMTIMSSAGIFIAHPDKAMMGKSAKDLDLWKDMAKTKEGYSNPELFTDFMK
ncbi:cache domain-containing protein [Neobacillus muris]|uniref:cache domain-containing protein n=1 Tax=Neobacillus muris TaxID=2941334 RepID=UPI00203BB98D|nr:cache domain-containing protein [Neobacillus muris]